LRTGNQHPVRLTVTQTPGMVGVYEGHIEGGSLEEYSLDKLSGSRMLAPI
jgi:hypothetical protein